MREAIEQMAAIAKAAGIRYVSFSVDDAATEAIATIPGAYVRETLYSRPTESYVIKSASVTLVGVHVGAQCHSRVATPDELVVPDDRWHVHAEQSYASTVKETSP